MKDTDAYRNWQKDEYLMSLDVPPNSKQRVEISKIQDSSKPIISMNFLDFVEIYHDLPYCMVDTLPEFMRWISVLETLYLFNFMKSHILRLYISNFAFANQILIRLCEHWILTIENYFPTLLPPTCAFWQENNAHF